jgi:serine/threonine protein kinase
MTSPTGLRALPYGERIGRWRLLDRASSGTFGVVLRARLMDGPDTEAALKVAQEPMDPRFEREAEVLSRCRSPHLPRLLDKGEWRAPGGQPYPYLVMQWVEGEPLYLWVRRRGLTNASAVRVLAHVARALTEVHARGGFHRDVKGDNVLVGPDGFAVLVDLGVATTTDAPPITEPGHLPPGTPQYRAPEALRFNRVGGERYEATPADDVYALGVMAWRLVTGIYPPPGTSSWSGEKLRGLTSPSELASVCPELDRIILRMLSKEPEARGSAEENARALEALLASGVPQLAGAIIPTVAMALTQRTEHPGPRPPRTLPTWITWAGSSALGALLAMSVWSLTMSAARPRESSNALVGSDGQEDAGVRDVTSGLADAGVDDIMASVHEFPAVHDPPYLAREMPKDPLKGQRKPPCDERGEKAINGACWYPVADERPPCGPTLFDFEGRCYAPTFNGARQRTSEEP